MTKKITVFLGCLLTLFTIFFVPSIHAQNFTNSHDHPIETPKPIPIDKRIQKQAEHLKQLNDTLASHRKQTTTPAVLAQLPFSSDTISDNIKQLNKTPITQQNIIDTEHLIEKTNDSITTIDGYIKRLENSYATLTETNKNLKALQQLLSNPVNQASISANEAQQVPLMIEQAEQLVPAYEMAINKENAYIKRLDQALNDLTFYKNALTETLNQQQQNQPEVIKENELANQRRNYENQVAALQNQLNSQRNRLKLNDIAHLQQSIYYNQTMAWLSDIDLQLINISNSLKPTNLVIQDAADIDSLEVQEITIRRSLSALDDLKNRVEERFTDFNQHTDIVGPDPELDEAFTQRMKVIAYQRLQLKNYPERLSQLITEKKQKLLFSRDFLYRDGNLSTGFSSISNSFVLIAYQIQISFQTLLTQIIKNPLTTLISSLVSLLAAGFLIRLINRWIARSNLKKTANKGILASLRKLFYTIRKNMYSLAILVFVLALVKFSNVPSPSDDIIYTLIYALAALIIWLGLAHIEVKLKTIDTRIERYGNLAAIGLALVAIVYTLSFLSSATPSVVDIYEKILMLTMIAFTLVFRKNINIYLSGEKRHLSNKAYAVYLWVIHIIPHLVIIACLLSLVGYGKLAWLILGYIGTLSLYLLIVTIGILLINMMRRWGKLYALKQFKHGAFVAQDIVSPLSTISKGLWLWFSAAILFALLGWNRNSYLIAKSLNILNYPLIKFGDDKITLLLVLLLILSIYLIFRIARWLKTFSYHWLFSRISDLGIRHSLSIFSQYVAVLVGVLTTLKIIGIDLTSLTVFAGALGVGVGLGLQDIAKNFISGVLLLIERPLRSGDWVNIDGSEGYIKSIGMRALTLETFDKQEVMIPNGNAINNSFTNYTHSNTITRTVLYVGAGYRSEPNLVIRVLENILDGIPAILKDPKSMIVMWEYGDSSINYRIQYYIDVNQQSSYGTRTEVLRAIWYAFEEHHIEIPFPQRDINFRNAINLDATNHVDANKTNHKNEDE